MNNIRRNSTATASKLVIRLSTLIMLMIGMLGVAQAQWSTSTGVIYTTTSSDKVGIGTTNPGEKIEVVGNIKLPATATATSGASYPSHQLRLFGSGWSASYGAGMSRPWDVQATGRNSMYGDSDFGLFYNGQSTPALYILGSAGYAGNVGIGTTNPYSKFHVSGGDISIDAGQGIRKAGDNWIIGYSTSLPGIAIGSGTASDQVTVTAGGSERLRILSNGNIGIGKTDPTAALDVQGDIKASGVIHARYQDVAEWVPSSEQLAAGTVVVLDSTKSNQVISSTVSYDTRVAGVVSAQPGITLGEKSDGKVLVATTGRVRVKVDATKGPIHVGDLLVTSDVPGVAMKSEPVNLGGVQLHRPGTLIGKALEPLAKGKGEILVLLSLQ